MSNHTIIGGIDNTIDLRSSASPGLLHNVVLLGGQGLVNSDNNDHVVIGRYNDVRIGSAVNRPSTDRDGTVIQFNEDGTTEEYQGDGRSPVLFQVGYGSGPATADRKDVFLVNREGVTWTRTLYTCAFGSDYAETFRVADCSVTPKAGDLITVDSTGAAHLFSEDHLKRKDMRIVGIVSSTPTIVGEGKSLLKHERDPDTLELILDEDEQPVLREGYTEDSTVREVTVGLVGRVLLKDKWLPYIPDRWLALTHAPESKLYSGYTYVLII